jgi:hypothetical protein
MDGANVFRLISLIPDRMTRSQGGTLFDATSSEKAELLSRFLGWLGPLSPTSKEEQQLLGVRAGGGKLLVDLEGGAEDIDESIDPLELADDVEDSPIRLPGAGTQIAA